MTQLEINLFVKGILSQQQKYEIYFNLGFTVYIITV